MKTLSDATLKSMTKAELIEQLRCAEHNYAVAQETIEQMYRLLRGCSACGEFILLEDLPELRGEDGRSK